MAVLTFSLKELLDEFVEPLVAELPVPVNPGAQIAYAAFLGATKDALRRKIEIPIPDADRGRESAGRVIADAMAPIDPAKALRDVANAVSEAEKAFNSQNLAVLSGKVNVQLMVNVGDAAGAQASFDLAIGPSPQG